MKFSDRKRRQAPTIIIVSLIDILIVLLIFLMVTTTFKQQPALKLVLPESRQAKPGTSQDAHNLLVTVDRKEPFLYLNQRAVTSDRLQEELTVRANKDPKIAVSIWPDTAAPVGQFLHACDAVAAAGVKNVRVLAKRPIER